MSPTRRAPTTRVGRRIDSPAGDDRRPPAFLFRHFGARCFMFLSISSISATQSSTKTRCQRRNILKRPKSRLRPKVLGRGPTWNETPFRHFGPRSFLFLSMSSISATWGSLSTCMNSGGTNMKARRLSWADFGCQVGAKSAPKSVQEGSKAAPKQHGKEGTC